MLLLIVVVGIVLSFSILRNPAIGLAVTAMSLPLQGVLPSVPMATSLVSALGGLTLLAYLVQKLRGGKFFQHGLQWQYALALGFFVWQLVSFPRASFYGSHNWTFTYIQLLILLWLASELLTPRALRLVMALYIIAAVISALYAFSEAQIADEYSVSAGLVRSEGLGGDENDVALYLALGFVFAAYFHREQRTRFGNLVFPLIYIALIMGIVGTVSRAGFLTFVLALVLLAGFWLSGGKRRARAIIIPAFSLIIAVQYVIPDSYFDIMYETIFTEDISDDTNFGSRQRLINIAWEVWKDHPATGVGVDQFRSVSRSYMEGIVVRGKAPPAQVPHNLYVTLLAENGLIGFLLFMGWIAFGLRDLLRTMWGRTDPYSALATIWLIGMLLFLFKGYTASTMHYDKLLWMMGGVSVAIYQGYLAYKRRDPAAQAEGAAYD